MQNKRPPVQLVLIGSLILLLMIVNTATSAITIENEKDMQTTAVPPIYSEGSFDIQETKVNGYDWTADEIIDGFAPLNDLKIALDGDENVHVFWSEYSSGDYYLIHAMRFKSNDTWSDQTILGYSSSETGAVIGVVTDDDGKLHVTWDSNNNVRYICYNNGVWENEQIIDFGLNPSIDVSSIDGKLNVVYKKQAEGWYPDYNYLHSQFNETSEDWDVELIQMNTYSPDGGSAYAYSLGNSAEGEESHLLTSFVSEYWYYDYQTYQRIHISTINYEMFRKDTTYSTFVNDGLDYESEIEVTVPVVGEPILVKNPSNDLYAFMNKPKEDGTYEIIYTRKGSGSWTSPGTLSTKSALKCELTATADQFGKVSLIWNYVNKTLVTRPDNTTKLMSTGTIYMKTYSPYTQTWSTDAPINTKERYSQYPSSTIDSDGNIYLVYVDVNLTDTSDKRLVFKKGWTDSDEDGLTNNVEVDIHGTDPYDADTDDDQMLDGEEIELGFDPFNWDEDNDNMADGYEVHYDLDPYSDDSAGDLDADLLTNIEEYLADTYANDNDTDDDAIDDYQEIKVHLTNPKNIDTDGDTVTDGEEILIANSNPLSIDSDNDTMTDGYEWNNYLNLTFDDSLEDLDNDSLINLLEFENNLRAWDPDHENDGLWDGDEVLVYGTNPIMFDTDGDGLWDGDEVINGIGGEYGTCPTDMDTDDDFLNDKTEIINGIDPLDNDTDNDLMLDGYEYIFGLDYFDASDASPDYDNDTLTNLEESYLWTDPFSTDSDGDKITDNYELELGSDPALYDTDGDGLNDYNEIFVLGTEFDNNDTDGDGLGDALEVYDYQSDPLDVDSDGDTLIDGDEVYVYGTDPASIDSDGDLLADNLELENNSNPLVVDSEGDGMDDFYEWTYGLNSTIDDSQIDTDNDGVINIEEYLHNANPLVNDTDLDGLTDFEEINVYYTLADSNDTDEDLLDDYSEIIIYNTSPHDPDSDDDGIEDGDEVYKYGTDPTKYDTDNDGVFDGQEIRDGTDPLDSSDNKNLKLTRLLISVFVSIIGGVLIYYTGPFLISKLSKSEESKWVKEGLLWRKQKGTHILETSHKVDTTEKPEEET